MLFVKSGVTIFKSMCAKIKGRMFLYIILVLLGLAVAAAYFILDSQFKIKKILIDVAAGSDNKYFTDILHDKNIIFSTEKELATFFVKANPLIKSATVYKKYPSTIKIVVVPYESSALLTVSDGYFALSAESVIANKFKNNNGELPLINYYQKLNYHQYQAGDTVGHSDITKAIDLSNYMLSIGLAVDVVDINGSDMIVLNSNGKRFVFSTKKNLETQKYEIKTIITKLKFEGREFVSLDLRFDKPVLKLQ